MHFSRRYFLSAASLVALRVSLHGQDLFLPQKANSVRFAVIGDMGTGDPPQYEIARKMTAYRDIFHFDFVLMLGDNIYGGNDLVDYQKKFEQPYKALLDAGVQFYGALGNHDSPTQRFYKPFNMNGQEYYTYKKSNVQFFAL